MKGSLNYIVLNNVQNFTHVISYNAITYVRVLVTQSCRVLCDPMGFSPPGSSVHEVLQARILKWAGDLPNPGIEPRSPTLQADSLPSEPPGKPHPIITHPFLDNGF